MKNLLLFFSLIIATQFSAQKISKMQMKDYKNIVNSKNIYEINAFLRDAHKDDPRRSVMKPKVMNLMKEYIEKAHPADQRVKEMQEMIALLKRRPSTKISYEEMNEIIKQKQIAHYKAQLEQAQKNITDNKGQAFVKPNVSYTAPQGQAAAAIAAGIPASASNTESAEFDLLMNESPMDHKMKTAKILTSLFDNDPMSKESIVMIKNNSDCNMIMRIDGAGNNKYRLAIPAKKEGSVVIEKGDYLFSSLVCGAQYASQKSVQKAVIVSLGNPGAISSTAK